MQNKFVCIAPERLRRSIKLRRRRQSVAHPRVSNDLAACLSLLRARLKLRILFAS